MRKELWFGFSIMALILVGIIWLLPAPADMTNGHLGLLMLALIVLAIMLGFPTAFTLMGMGMIFAYLAYRSQDPSNAAELTLDLMVQRAYGVMTNDVLISVPLFVFMGYLVERANLIEKLFKSLHLAMARVPGSLAVATLVTCAIFATATGIVGAVVTLMGLLAFPAMLRAGYNIKLSAGVITAGGCLGILIPPSVLLIVYGATAGVSVVQLYAGAFFPGIMLAGLYVVWVILLAKLRPNLAPPLSAADRRVTVPPVNQAIASRIGPKALPALYRALGRGDLGVSKASVLGQLIITLAPALVFAAIMALAWQGLTKPIVAEDTGGLVEIGGASSAPSSSPSGLQEPPSSGLQEPPAAPGLQEPPGAAPAAAPAQTAPAAAAKPPVTSDAPARQPAPMGFWITLAVGIVWLLWRYRRHTFENLEVFKMLLTSFFPLAIMIIFVLGAIVFGLATPTEAAAVGALGGALLALAYGQLTWGVIKESVFLTAKTSAMVCWLFVGSSIFSAAFALLGGQEVVEKWVLSLNLTPTYFMVLSQVVIFLLGWPLEWTEIIVIFMPIFIPLLGHFHIDPLFFGLLVALNLQTAFLSPPVAMAAFYLKGVSPPHVTLNQIFAGMMPFMAIQILAIILLYLFPGIGLWLPQLLYSK